MDNATLARLLNTYNSQNLNVNQQLSQAELSLPTQNFNQERDGDQHATKVEQPLPGT